MRKIAFAIALIFLLAFSGVIGTLVKLVQANPIYKPGYLTVAKIISPENKTYDTNIIPLIIITGDHQLPSTGYYSVDGGPEIKINENAHPSATFEGEINLADGPHSILVTTKTVGRACAIVHFTIATIPAITVMSLENITYYSSDLMLNFTVNEPVSLVAYSLDGGKNVTVFGNTSLPRLSLGSHSIVVYAWDTAFVRNVGASETITFTVEEPPDPTILVITTAVIVAVVLVGIGLLLCGIKRK